MYIIGDGALPVWYAIAWYRTGHTKLTSENWKHRSADYYIIISSRVSDRNKVSLP